MMDHNEEASTPNDHLHLLSTPDSSCQLNGQSLASAKMLFDTRRVKFTSPDHLKINKGDASTDSDLNRVLDHTHYVTSIPKSKLKCSLGQAIWLPNEQLALVTQRKGTLGFHRHGKYYLHPEEAAFAIDNCEYEITLDSLPISLEEAFTIFFRSQHEQDIFRVYSVLRKHGFRVQRFTHPSNVSEDKCKVNTETAAFATDCYHMATSSTGKREQSSDEDSDKTNSSSHVDHCKKVKLNNMTTVSDDYEMTDMTDDFSVKPLNIQMIYGEDKYLSHPMNLLLKHKCKDWKQFKNPRDIFQPDSKLTGSVVQFTQIPFIKHVDNSLPPVALKSDSIEPIIKLDRVMSVTQLLNQLQAKGPKTYTGTSHPHVLNGCSTTDAPVADEPSSSTLQIVFEVKTSLKHPFHVAVTSYRDDFPHFNQLQKLFNSIDRASLVLAVVDEYTVHFYKLSPFEIWQEVPVKWIARAQ